MFRIGENGGETYTPSFMEAPELSRNAASSRAIPTTRLIQAVMDDPAIPIYWGKNQRGMQATEQFSVEEQRDLIAMWLAARDDAVHHAKELAEIGVHKQVVNRLIEPFSHITVVVTATDWANFFEQRDHADAEPHIRDLARAMRKAIAGATPRYLASGEWHLPFATHPLELPVVVSGGVVRIESLRALSVARCGSASYDTVEGFAMTIDRASALHNKFLFSRPIHYSPMEHQAMAEPPRLDHAGGNLGPGWAQYRKIIERAHKA